MKKESRPGKGSTMNKDKGELILLKGNKGSKGRGKAKKHDPENLREDLLQAFPFLQRIIFRTNELDIDFDELTALSMFLRCVDIEVIRLVARCQNPRIIIDKGLRKLVVDSVDLTVGLCRYIDDSGKN